MRCVNASSTCSLEVVFSAAIAVGRRVALMLVRSLGLLRDAHFGGQVHARDHITDGEGHELRQRALLQVRVADQIQAR